MSSKLLITGDGALIQALKSLDRKIARKTIRKAITKAVKPIRVAYKANVPVKHGWLKKAVGSKVKTGRGGKVSGIIGARSDLEAVVPDERTGKPRKIRPAKYQHLVEFGTRPHTIKVGKRRIKHPGSAGSHPLGRAFQAHAQTAMTIIETTIRQEIESSGR